jgi:hypothetical protein
MTPFGWAIPCSTTNSISVDSGWKETRWECCSSGARPSLTLMSRPSRAGSAAVEDSSLGSPSRVEREGSESASPTSRQKRARYGAPSGPRPMEKLSAQVIVGWPTSRILPWRARRGLREKGRGPRLPHLAKNGRDMGHPLVRGQWRSSVLRRSLDGPRL